MPLINLWLSILKHRHLLLKPCRAPWVCVVCMRLAQKCYLAESSRTNHTMQCFVPWPCVLSSVQIGWKQASPRDLGSLGLSPAKLKDFQEGDSFVFSWPKKGVWIWTCAHQMCGREPTAKRCYWLISFLSVLSRELPSPLLFFMVDF